VTGVALFGVLACVFAGCNGAMGEMPPETEVVRPAESLDVPLEAFSEVRVPLQAVATDAGLGSSRGPAPILVPEGTSERGAFSFEPDDSWYSFQKEMEKDVGFAFPHETPPEGTRMLEKIDDGEW